MLFESDGTTGRMVSTDGHRLSKVARPLAGGPKLATGVLIPRKGIVELRRAIETARGAVRDRRSRRATSCSRRTTSALSVKLIDGQFPPYDQVIPKDNDRAFVVSRLALLDALRRVSHHVLGQDLRACGSPSRRASCAIESDNPDLGAAREEIDIPYKGAAVQIGFNARYFIELLSRDRDARGRVELAGELDPGVVRPADGSDYVGVVMPMRL